MSKTTARRGEFDLRAPHGEPTEGALINGTSRPRIERRQFARRDDTIAPPETEGLANLESAPIRADDLAVALVNTELTRKAAERLRPQPNVAKTGGYLLVTSLLAAGIAYGSVMLAHLFLFGDEPTPYLELSFFAAVSVGLLHLISRPDRQRTEAPLLEASVEAGREMGIAVVAMLVLAFFLRPYGPTEYSFSRATVLLSFAIGTIALAIARSSAHTALSFARRRGSNLASIVVVGDTPSARAFIDTVRDNPGTGYRVVAHIDEGIAHGDLATTLELVAQDVYFTEVVVASRALSRAEVAALVGRASLRNVGVRVLPELFGLLPARLELETLVGFPLLSLFERPAHGIRFLMKRSVDLVVSSLLLLVLGPLLLATALAIRLTSPGPALFRQDRVGQRGKRFEIIKFRSMFVNSSESPHESRLRQMLSGDGAPPDERGLFKPKGDPRVTPVGRFIRRYSIDELPQLLNVLSGEMSLVGPRPVPTYELDLFREESHHRRFDVLPGMTGLWQVSGRSRLSANEMLRLDAQYAENWSLLADLKIIIRTIPAVFRDDAG
jgi:exopolysaccharide biosynthesis polyprenyl glycosylphosphotransferase